MLAKVYCDALLSRGLVCSWGLSGALQFPHLFSRLFRLGMIHVAAVQGGRNLSCLSFASHGHAASDLF